MTSVHHGTLMQDHIQPDYTGVHITG